MTRSTAPAAAPGTAPDRAAGPRAGLPRLAARRPAARDVVALTDASGYPSISVLLPTQPGPRMVAADVEQLEELVREVGRTLTAAGVPARDRLMSRLTELASLAARQPTDRGLAIYASLALDRCYRLSRPVLTRAVVEQTFATRDLLQELHRTPPVVLLVLETSSARLYQLTGGAMRLVGQRDMFARPAPLPEDDEREEEQVATFLDGVDRLLGAYRAEHPSPLLLAGSPWMLDRLTRTSSHLHRLAGRLDPDATRSPLSLSRAAAALLEDYLRSRRAEALERLAVASETRPGDVVRGMAACWEAVHQVRPELLLVEEDFVCAGPAARHDLVDDLMELVIVRGGQLAIVAAGDLADVGRVALIARP